MKGDFLSIGRLGSPKGVRGDLKVQSYSGETDHFFKLKEVSLRSPEGGPAGVSRELRLRVARIEGRGSGLTMAFEGYASPEAARVLVGMEIVAPRAEAAPLRENEWYVVDLVGLSLVAGGEKVAVVRSVLEGGSDPWLEVVVAPRPEEPAGARGPGAGPAGGARVALVPFRKEFVGAVDLAGGTVELLVPELLEP